MNMFRITAALLALCMSLMTLPASAENVSGNPEYTVDAPPAYSMVADLLIARPLLIA